MNIKEILDILKNYNLSPNKKFGQNFLCDDEIIRKIINVSEVSSTDKILEIGPGLGAITSELLKTCDNVTAIEIDSGFYNLLSEKYGKLKNFRLIHGDFLKVKIESNFDKVIANLPYYCSSEILFNLARNYKVDKVIVMVQKEMADRLKSKAGTREYGAMTASLNLYYDINFAFNVSHHCFFPKPDVLSSIIILTKKKHNLSDSEVSLFHEIIKSVFWGRRKTILKSLTSSPHLKLKKETAKKLIEISNLDLSLRGDMLSTENFSNLAVNLNKLLLNENKISE